MPSHIYMAYNVAKQLNRSVNNPHVYVLHIYLVVSEIVSIANFVLRIVSLKLLLNRHLNSVHFTRAITFLKRKCAMS